MSSHDDVSLERSSPLASGAGDSPPASSGGRRPRRRVKRWHVFGAIGSVVVVAVLVASLITIPYYALTPGQAQPVAPLINLPASVVHHASGSVLLVDVEETQMRAIDWLFFKLDNNATIVKASSILGTETAAQYNTEGVIDMSDAQQAATVVALRELGFKVEVTGAGALLYALQPGSPAEADLAVGDVIIAVGTRPVTSADGLTVALASLEPGIDVHLTIRAYPSRATEHATVPLGTWRIAGKGKEANLQCFPQGHGTRDELAYRYPNGALGFPPKGETARPVACLGVLDAEDAFSIAKLPFKVDLSSEGIVGPSAGLAFTLGLMEKLDPDNLTGGHKVAATGTMAINGAVGTIGGVEQKTIAVRGSGASLFLVPPGNFKRAEAFAGSHLHVVAVSTITQAISALERYGGKLRKVS